MKIAEMLLQAREGLAQWAGTATVGAQKGTAEIANDPVHLFALLAQKPGAVRVCLLFRGQSKRGEFEEAGEMDRKFWAVVSRGRGFTVEPEASLYHGNAGEPPLFDLVEEAVEVIRGFSFADATTEVTPDLKEVELFPMPEGSRAVDAYYIEFWIGVQLPDVLPRRLAANRDLVDANDSDVLA